MTGSDEWFERARRVLPGGVSSPVRAFRAVGGTPRVIRSACGCRLTDVDGREYIDYVGSWGATIAGHAHGAVLAAAAEAASRGTSYGLLSTPEVELAEEITARVPSVAKVRLVNSGTEAVMSAIRLARAATGRSRIIKFEGGYHGHADAMLVRAGSGAATFGIPDSPGVPPGAVGDTSVLPYNDAGAVVETFRRHGAEIAAVIIEPVAANMGVVPPERGFLESCREATRRQGALLIFDEVVTGFRLARGGAQQVFGIEADLVTFGKIIGGGFPVGAYAGRSEVMNLVAPEGPVYQAGTLAGNPVATAAGLATLRLLDAEAYARLERLSSRLESGLRRVFVERREDVVVQRAGSMLTVFFTREPVRTFQAALQADHRRFASFFRAMLAQGVHLPPSGYEAWFVSLAHDEAAIDRTIDAARATLAN
jgi:glutamate-1-semialdehyde 2,1-aminomutase